MLHFGKVRRGDSGHKPAHLVFKADANEMKILFTDHRSILANTDWKKLWMETGQLMNRIDNNIDSSDSTLPEESEVRLVDCCRLTRFTVFLVSADNISESDCTIRRHCFFSV